MKKKSKRLSLDDVDTGQTIVVVTRYHDHIGRFEGVIRGKDGRWFINIKQRDGALVAVPAKSVQEILSI